MNSVRPALFLDRDGTLIEDRGYLKSPKEIRWYPDTFTALERIKTHFALFIVTNQNGISKGLITRKEAESVNNAVVETLHDHGIPIEEVYTCPHTREEDCQCRKPKPYFLHRAVCDHGISIEASFSLGDHLHDVDLCRKAGGDGIYLLTGHGRHHRNEIYPGIHIAENLSQAADILLRKFRPVPEICLTPEEGAAALRNGEIIGLPTETVYGLAGNGLEESSILKIFEAKKRPFFDPLILHITDRKQLLELTSELPEEADRLIERFWPGPLTLVLPRSSMVPDLVTAGLETVAIRMPSHPVARRIIEEAGCPVAAPSANLFGSISPSRASHVIHQLGDRIAGVVDGGACTIGIESTIVGFWEGKKQILRQGGIPQEALEEVIGPIGLYSSSEKSGEGIPAPGTLKQHYAPRTPFDLIPGELFAKSFENTGFLLFGNQQAPDGAPRRNLSPSGNLEEAAVRLYHFLRELDALGLERIVATPLPEEGLGRGINDRLRRASAR